MTAQNDNSEAGRKTVNTVNMVKNCVFGTASLNVPSVSTVAY
jgi:hypothetical protein